MQGMLREQMCPRLLAASEAEAGPLWLHLADQLARCKNLHPCILLANEHDEMAGFRQSGTGLCSLAELLLPHRTLATWPSSCTTTS